MAGSSPVSAFADHCTGGEEGLHCPRVATAPFLGTPCNPTATPHPEPRAIGLAWSGNGDAARLPTAWASLHGPVLGKRKRDRSGFNTSSQKRTWPVFPPRTWALSVGLKAANRGGRHHPLLLFRHLVATCAIIDAAARRAGPLNLGSWADAEMRD